MLEPVVGAGARLASFFWYRGGTVSHRLVGVGAGADVVAPFSVDVALRVGVGVGAGSGAGARAGFGFGFGFGVGTDLSCLPGCSCWRSSGFFGSPVCVRSACIEASRPTPSVSAFLSSLWPRSVVATTLLTMSVMPLPHSTSSWWYASRFSSFSSNHIFIPRQCASCSAVRVSSMFAIFAMVRCSCASSRACCWAARSLRLSQSPRAQAVAGTSHLLRFPFSFLSIGSSVASPAVPAAMDVTAVAISIAISIGASLLPSAVPPVSRRLLSLTLTSVITSVSRSSSRLVLVVAPSLVDASGRSRSLPRLRVNTLNCLDSCARHPPADSLVLGRSLRGQFDVQNRLPPSVC